ncbi:MAG TPA: Vms1/Ankzf1 family peptidyl-tRNA hydrolase [Gaiellaceae bacterium]|nr:Vms1/Ankzf1 family peptidyl-tRNA hydrolase [Gaiellaceae bacterium]
MARTVTWDELRGLAGFEAEKGCAISVYLDLDPRVSPTAGDAATRLNSLLDEGARADGANRRDLSHDQRQGLRSDFERIRRYFETEFSRDGARGLAIFCAGLDNVWRPLPLTETVSDDIKIGHRLYLAPLVPLVGRGEGALVVVVSRELGHFYRLQAGRLENVADHFDEQPRRHDQGGWSQARFQRHVDTLAQEHLRTVAEELDRLVRRLRGPQVVVVASEDTWAEFSGMLAQETRSVVAGVAHAEAHAPPSELLEVATPVLERWRAERERQVVERWREEAGRDGRAAAGWAETLEAASDGRVELLLFQEGVSHAARRCPACGRVAAEESKCPLDGTQMEDSREGLDLAVHQTLTRGGTVWAVRHRRDLDPVEGIGALLRY